ncbi:MAG: hypothetical protein EXR07_14165 [Acetobacteraceae bacterium]|nr:hypothetical protein [Acetobacteraceae bacterium]
MDHLLAGTEIRLTYLQDHRALARIDWAAVFDDLTDAGAPPNRCQWRDLDELTHVVLATDRVTGRHAGLLGLVERKTLVESYLSIDAAMVRPGDDGLLPRAMLAHILARIVCLDGKPIALAAPPHDQTIEIALRGLGDAITGADPYPSDNGTVIAFATAALARRIGPSSTILDLRTVLESSLLRDLRRLHRARPERVKARLGRLIPRKPAKTGGSTRHPRTATRTGRNG